MQLVQAFALKGDEAAFSEIVTRHVALVRSTAWRLTSNDSLAQEVTQAVFIILSRKAASLGANTILSAWLYRTTCYAAADALKIEHRRQHREQEAYMRSILSGSTSDPDPWNGLAPLLDGAMADLNEVDRTVLVLKYFQNKSSREIAASIHTKEEAAQKLASRALEKLRKLLVRRGTDLPLATLAALMISNSAQAVTHGFTDSIAETALRETMVSESTAELVQKTLKTMKWLKIKSALSTSIAILVVGGGVSVAVSQIGTEPKLTRGDILRKSQAAYAAMTSYSDEGNVVATMMGTRATHHFTIKLSRPDRYRIEWEQTVEANASPALKTKGSVWGDGQEHFLENGAKTRTETNMESALSSATGISGGAAASIPGAFFNTRWNHIIDPTSRIQEQQPDETLSGIDCYVFSTELKGRKITVWIGTSDFLIRQIQTVTSAQAMRDALAAAAKANPEAAARIPKIELSDSTSTETHEHIAVNKKLSIDEFQKGTGKQ